MDIILRSFDPKQIHELKIAWPKDANMTIAKFLWFNAKLKPKPICAGMGRCGLCQIRLSNNSVAILEEEKEILGIDKINQGFRLACRHKIAELEDSKKTILEISPDLFSPNSNSNINTIIINDQNKTDLDLAIDLGTTNICWRAFEALSQKDPDKKDLSKNDLDQKDLGPKNITEGIFLNPQAPAGSDVISRLGVALEDKTWGPYLALVIKNSLRQCIARLPGTVRRCVLVGNTIMTSIFLEKDLRSFIKPPYTSSYKGHEWLNLPGLPEIYIPPLPGPFVGSDLSAGLLAIWHKNYPPPWLLVDLGTNAEFALYTKDEKLYLTSVPLGPALEGIGMRCGGLANEHSATSFRLTPFALIPESLDDHPPTKISATGYLSLLANLINLKILSPSGKFCANPSLPLAQKIRQNLRQEHGRTVFRISKDLFLDGFDIEEMLKVKAAFATAIQYLLAQGNLNIQDLRQILLAGALGTFAAPQTLEILGFLPQGLGQLVKSVGNTALEGACLLLKEKASPKFLAHKLEQATLINLTGQAKFQETFLQNMFFGSQF